MKVTIAQEKQSAMIKPKGILAFAKRETETIYYSVTMKIDLTQEERAALSKYDLWDTVVGEHHFVVSGTPEISMAQAPDIPLPLSIKDYASDDGYIEICNTAVEARVEEFELRSRVLPLIKKHIECAADWQDGPRTFEM